MGKAAGAEAPAQLREPDERRDSPTPIAGSGPATEQPTRADKTPDAGMSAPREPTPRVEIMAGYGDEAVIAKPLRGRHPALIQRA